MKMQKISPCLWFDREAKEAADFYTSIFPNSKIVNVAYYGEGAPRPKGTVLTVTFELEGQTFIALNGGPEHAGFTPAISLFVSCATQAEVDALWDKLLAGGKPVACGWLTDKYGVSWQIVPKILLELLQDKDAAKARRVMDAMMKMVKLDIATLQRAAAGAA